MGKGRIGAALGVGASIATILALFLQAGSSSSTSSAPDPQPAAAAAYPQDVQDNYLSSCEQSASASACQCTLDWFQTNVPLARFEQDDQQAAAGQEPADLAAAVQACS